MNQYKSLVSVVIPIYNGEKFINSVIASIKKQKYEPLEIIIIDDGSTDNTAKIIAQLDDDIKYIYQENEGPASARNKGINIAKGDFITFLDVDDLWGENKLKNQVNYLQKNPLVDIIQGFIQKVKINQLEEQKDSILIPISDPYYYINIGSCLYRKLVFEKIGLFNENMRYGEDTDFMIRAWENNINKVLLNEVCLFYCKHEWNMTKDKNIIELGLLRILRQRYLRCQEQGKILNNLNISLSEYLGTSLQSNVKFN